jgi:hypothetical protein
VIRPFLILSIVLTSSAFGQTAQTLPSSVLGSGISYQRGASYPLVENTVYGHNFTTTNPDSGKKIQTNWYLWTQASTPIAHSPASGPLASTISAGVTYVAAQSASGSVLVTLTALGGLSASASQSGGQFNGNIGVAFRLGKSNFYVMPYLGGSALPSGPGSGTFVTQPGITFLYGFFGKGN